MDTSIPFLWGVASSSHQVEGGNANNDWWEWEHMPGKIKHGDTSGNAVDHYNRYEEDFDIAKQIGSNAFRISIEWSRIMPKPGTINEQEIQHYRNVLEALANRNMRTMVTLHHFTNPLWIAKRGAWENPDTVNAFAQYAGVIARELGNTIDFFITINEPMVYLAMGYSRGVWPPGSHSILRGRQAYNGLVAGHRAAVHSIRKHCPKTPIGIAKHLTAFSPLSKNPLHKTASGVSSWFFNDRFTSAIADTSDFLGINFYFSDTKRFCFNPSSFFSCTEPWNGPKTDLGWPINPDGFSQVLRHAAKFNLPIIVTENGLADASDTKRGEYIQGHTNAMLKARKDGVPIHGYLHWTLTDNFEWHEGFDPKFGLVDVDRKTQKRTVRPSAHVYSDIIKNNP